MLHPIHRLLPALLLSACLPSGGGGGADRDGDVLEPPLSDGTLPADASAPDAAAPVDDDGDGHPAGPEDCDDTEPTVHVGAEDQVGDGLDQNCDGADGVDADADGHASLASGGDDCDDGAPTTHPDAPDRGDPVVVEVAELEQGAQSSAIAVDDEGGVHVFFGERYREDRLVRLAPAHATNRGGEWASARIAPADSSGIGVALTFGGGALHAAFGGGAMRYATLGPGADAAWAVEEVAEAGWPGELAVDAGGHPHLVFSTREGLTYGRRTEAGWETTLVAAEEPSFGTLAVGPGDVAHVGWANAEGAHVAAEADGWTPQRVLEGPAAAARLAFDGDGRRRVVAVAGDRATLQYAAEGEAGGVVEQVAEVQTLSVGRYDLELRVGPDGGVHALVGWHHNGAHLLYLHRAPAGGWATHVLFENDATHGNEPSFTLTPDGRLHLAYTVSRRMAYATSPAANGVDDDCDGDVW